MLPDDLDPPLERILPEDLDDEPLEDLTDPEDRVLLVDLTEPDDRVLLVDLIDPEDLLVPGLVTLVLGLVEEFLIVLFLDERVVEFNLLDLVAPRDNLFVE